MHREQFGRLSSGALGPAIAFTAFCLAIVVALTRPAFADNLSVHAGLLNFNFAEFALSGNRLLQESGWLPGGGLQWSRAWSDSLSTRLGAEFYRGVADYRGQTQAGIGHRTETEETLASLGVQLTRNFEHRFGLFLGLRLRDWQRDIQDNNGVFGLSERFRWQEWSTGVKFDGGRIGQGRLYFEIGLLAVREAEMDVDINRAGLGGTELSPGNGEGLRMQAAWRRNLAENHYYQLMFFHESWEFARSNINATSGGAVDMLVVEPENRSRHTGIAFAFGFKLE